MCESVFQFIYHLDSILYWYVDMINFLFRSRGPCSKLSKTLISVELLLSIMHLDCHYTNSDAFLCLWFFLLVSGIFFFFSFCKKKLLIAEVLVKLELFFLGIYASVYSHIFLVLNVLILIFL